MISFDEHANEYVNEMEEKRKLDKMLIKYDLNARFKIKLKNNNKLLTISLMKKMKMLFFISILLSFMLSSDFFLVNNYQNYKLIYLIIIE
jgi:hypothetical protein